MEVLKVVETFSGIGAQSKALRRANIEHQILNTADWDINAIIAYDLIHHGEIDDSKYSILTRKELLEKLKGLTLSLDGKKPAKPEMIEKLDIDVLKKLCAAIDRSKNLISVTDINGEDLEENMDILTYSFPCQDLSVAGFWHGNKGGINRDANNRSSMLWQIERILLDRKSKNLSMPKFLLMENVRNIMSHQHEANFTEWQNSLKNMGYKNYPLKLDASNFGIPQKRVRIYMVSILTNGNKELEDKISKYFHDHNLENEQYVKSLNLTQKNIKDFLRTDYVDPRYKLEADYSQPADTKSRREIEKKNILLFDGVKYTNQKVPTVTTKQDRHPNSGIIKYDGCIIGKSDFRYLTPRECFLLMGFDEDDYQVLIDNNFKKNGKGDFFTRDKLNKMAGNSIVVNVLEEIFKQIDYINNNIFDNRN